MQWTVEEYTDITNKLLEKHFGINLNDTGETDESIQDALNEEMEPWELVNSIAEDAEIFRIDTGWASESRILENHQNEMMFPGALVQKPLF